MTKFTLPIIILIMLVISPLFFSVTELNGDDERVLVSDLQISQQVDCTTTPNINCRIDREVYESLTYRDIFESNNLFDNSTMTFELGEYSFSTGQPISALRHSRIDSFINVTPNQEFKIYFKSFFNFGLDEPNSFRTYEFDENGNYLRTNLYLLDDNIIISNDTFKIRFRYFWNVTFHDFANNYNNIVHQHLNETFLMIDVETFTIEPTQQQLDQWLEYYLEHKDQGIINDFYHIQSDTLINMSHQAYNGIDNLIVRTNNFIDWLTLDVASLLSRSIGFLGDKTYEILDDVGVISNDFTWWADFNDSLPTWLKRLVGLE